MKLLFYYELYYDNVLGYNNKIKWFYLRYDNERKFIIISMIIWSYELEV